MNSLTTNSHAASEGHWSAIPIMVHHGITFIIWTALKTKAIAAGIHHFALALAAMQVTKIIHQMSGSDNDPCALPTIITANTKIESMINHLLGTNTANVFRI